MNSIVSYMKLIGAATWMATVGGRGELAQLREKTAIVNSDALSADVCLRLIAKIEGILRVPDHPRVWRDGLGSDNRILGFEYDIGDLLDAFALDRWTRAINAYTGQKTRSWFLMANKVVPKKNNLGSGGGMHRDSPFSHQAKCIWYLNDVSGENGPFQYVAGSNVHLLRTRSIYPIGETRFKDVRGEMIEVHGRAGTQLVCDTRCIHGGKPMVSGVRYAVTLYTSPDPRDKERRVVSMAVA